MTIVNEKKSRMLFYDVRNFEYNVTQIFEKQPRFCCCVQYIALELHFQILNKPQKDRLRRSNHFCVRRNCYIM